MAVVGPRQGADTDIVGDFVRQLYRENPAITLISGGAKGVDSVAESTWFGLGGLVWSFRIRQLGQDTWAAEKWVYSQQGDQNARFVLQGHPTFMDPVSALFYRSTLAADEADQVVAFEGRGKMRGTEFTYSYAKDRGIPVHLWQDGRWAPT